MVMNGKGARRCRRRVAMVASLVVAGLGVAACGTSGNSSDATGGITPVARATSTHRSTPPPSAQTPKVVKVSATPVPGTKQDALFLEAKQVYETYLEQIYKLEVGSDVNSLTSELQGILSKDGSEAILKAYSDARSRGHRVLPADIPYSSVSINRRPVNGDFDISTVGCADISKWRFVSPKTGKLTPGHKRKDALSMRRIDGVLKIVEAESSEVESCRI